MEGPTWILGMFKHLYNAIRFSILARKSGKLSGQERYEESLNVLDQMIQLPVADFIKAGIVIIKGNTFTKMGRDREAIECYEDFLQNHQKDIKLDRDRIYLRAYTIFLRDHAARRLDQSHPITISKQEVLELGKKATLMIREDYQLN